MGSASRGATDASGSFEFDHVNAGTYRLIGSLGSRNSLPQEVTVTAGQNASGIVLSLVGGAAIVGNVTGLPPAELAAVRITASNGAGFNGSGTPNASGAYEIDGAPPGEIRVNALVTGLQGRSLSQTTEIGNDASQVEVDLAFPAGGTLSGTVTRGGQPQPQVWISVQPETAGSSPTSGRGTTDENGRYSIGGLEDGDYLVRSSSLFGAGASAPHEQTVTISGDTSLDIDLPTLSASGTVTEQGSNDPVAGVTVMIDSGEAQNTFAIQKSVTDSSGHFEIDGLSAGDFQLSANKTRWQSVTQPLALQDSTASLTVALARAEGITVHGLDGTTGIPLSQIEAVFFSGGGGVGFDGSIQLDGTGLGEIPQLAPGSYVAYFFARGYAPQALGSVSIPTAPLTIAFTFGGELDIRTDAAHAGAPATLATASGLVYLSSAFNFNPQFALAGTLTQKPRLAPGGYTLTIQWPDGPKNYPLTIVEGQATPVVVP